MISTPPSTDSPSDPNATNRFTSQASTAEDLLKSQTVGLVHLSDFRKRRAEAIEEKERQASTLGRFAAASSYSTRPSSGTATPNSNDGSAATPIERPKKKRKPAQAKGKLSFGVDEDEDTISEGKRNLPVASSASPSRPSTPAGTTAPTAPAKSRLGPNSTLSNPAPRALTKSAIRVDQLARESLRRDFLAMQEAVRSTSIDIPFVFYDGTNIPGGTCTIKKGEQIWLLLDRARKVGAKTGGGRRGTTEGAGGGGGVSGAGASGGNSGGQKGRNKNRSHWARIGVDDLLLVRGEVIIPHHYEIYYFIVNKTLGPNSKPLFDYSSTASVRINNTTNGEDNYDNYNPLSKSSSHRHRRRRKHGADDASAANGNQEKEERDSIDDDGDDDGEENKDEDQQLEGTYDDPNYTKVVDRRWYERNKHIFPASQWEAFDPDKVYEGRVRKDAEGNAFFFSS